MYPNTAALPLQGEEAKKQPLKEQFTSIDEALNSFESLLNSVDNDEGFEMSKKMFFHSVANKELDDLFMLTKKLLRTGFGEQWETFAPYARAWFSSSSPDSSTDVIYEMRELLIVLQDQTRRRLENASRDAQAGVGEGWAAFTQTCGDEKEN